MGTATEQLTVFKYEDLLQITTEQIKNLIELGYHVEIGKSADEFFDLCLKNTRPNLPEKLLATENEMPVLLVLPHTFFPREKQIKILGIGIDCPDAVWWTQTEKIFFPKPYLVYRAEYGPAGKIPPHLFLCENQEKKPLTIDQGLALIAQAEELQSYCPGLFFAGSKHYIKNIPYVPCFSAEEKKITSVYNGQSDCRSEFAACAKNSFIFSLKNKEDFINNNF